MIADDAGKLIFYDGATGAAENVADEEDSHFMRSKFDGNTPGWPGRLSLRSHGDQHLTPTQRRQLSGAEEIVIAGRIQLHILHPLVVYENVVEIPEIDVREFLGENLLQFGVE